MAKEKNFVNEITARDVDFAQWFTDICLKAELVDYSSVQGFYIMRPYGWALWENIQKSLDAKFKRTGHENVAMPMLIPESAFAEGKGQPCKRLCTGSCLGYTRRQQGNGRKTLRSPYKRNPLL